MPYTVRFEHGAVYNMIMNNFDVVFDVALSDAVCQSLLIFLTPGIQPLQLPSLSLFFLLEREKLH